MTPINDALNASGLHHTRMNRYMTGSGSPSIHSTAGSCGACGDYATGYDNVTTPREFAYFLQLMHVNPGLLLEPDMHRTLLVTPRTRKSGKRTIVHDR